MNTFVSHAKEPEGDPPAPKSHDEIRELLACDVCTEVFALQDVEFFEGPGSWWVCQCPHCGTVCDPERVIVLEGKVHPFPRPDRGA